MASAIALKPIERIGFWSKFDKHGERDHVEEVLTTDYWRKLYPSYCLFQKEFQFLQTTMPLIRQAYFSAKSRGDHIDIVNLLQDRDSRMMIFHLTFCLKTINHYSSAMGEKCLFWTKNYQQITGLVETSTAVTNVCIEPSAGDQKSSGKLEVLDKTKMDPISIKVYDTLIILKEILANMGIHPQLSERNKRDNKSAELMCLVADGVSLFRSVSRRNDKALTKILDSVYKLFAVDSEEYKLGLSCDEVRYEQTEEMAREIGESLFAIRAGCEESYTLKFYKVMEVISWYPDL